MASTEVRKCAHCHAPAVVLVLAWQHTVNGTATGYETREYRCQECARAFVVRPRMRILPLWIAGGVLTVTTCIGGLPLLLVAWLRQRVESTIPVVDAPVPPLRFPGGPPRRRCAQCSALVSAVRITRNSHNGVPTGTEYEYRCAPCNREFTVESPLGMSMNAFGGALLFAGGAAFLAYAQHPGWRFGGGGACVLLGLLLAGQVVQRLANRLRNPVVDERTAMEGVSISPR